MENRKSRDEDGDIVEMQDASGKRTAEASGTHMEDDKLSGDDHDDHEHGDDHDDDHEAHWKVFRWHEWQRDRECLCWCGYFCAFIFCLILIVVILVAGHELIVFTTEFPFYILSHRSQQRMDGVKQTHLKATHDFGVVAGSETGQRTKLDGNIVHILYVKDGDNIMTADQLERIHKFENRLLAKSAWEDDMCLLVEGKCVRPMNPVSFFTDNNSTATRQYFPQKYDDYPTYENTVDYLGSYAHDQRVPTSEMKLSLGETDAEAQVKATATFWARYNNYKDNALPALPYFEVSACTRQQAQCAVVMDWREATYAIKSCADNTWTGTITIKSSDGLDKEVANCAEAVSYINTWGLGCDDLLAAFGSNNSTARHYCCETCFKNWYPDTYDGGYATIPLNPTDCAADVGADKLTDICLNHNKGTWTTTTEIDVFTTEVTAGSVSETNVKTTVENTLKNESPPIPYESVEIKTPTIVGTKTRYIIDVKYPWSTKLTQGLTMFNDIGYATKFSTELQKVVGGAQTYTARSPSQTQRFPVSGKKEVYAFNIESPPFYDVVDGKFASSSNIDEAIKAEALKSAFPMGVPVKGYSKPGESTIKQKTKLGEYCYKNWQDIFDDGPGGGMTVYWHCKHMSGFFTDDKLAGDMTLLMFTILFIFFYMVFATGSYWLGCNGMFMIFMNFAPSILLYGLVFQQSYFGILQVMSMFLILAIGADDVFVLIDTWSQVNCEHWRDRDMYERLSYSLRHAAKVMGTTSASTIFSFIANVTSEIPAIWTFGLFCAILIFVNYCAVCTYYPAVLICHEVYFQGEGKTAHIPYIGWLFNCGFRTEQENLKQRYERYAEDEELQKKIPVIGVLRPIDEWFGKVFYYKVHQLRLPILIAGTVLFCVFLGFASGLKPDPDPPNIFPPGHNYGVFWNKFTDYFSRATSDQNVIAWVAIGLTGNGIDRAGTDSTDPKDLGEPTYDEKFNPMSAEAMEFLTAMCDDLESGRRYGDGDKRMVAETAPGAEPAVECQFTAYRNWIWSADSAANYDIEKSINPLTKTFVDPALVECVKGQDPPVHHPGTWPVYGFYNNLVRFSDFMTDEMPSGVYGYQAGRMNYDHYQDTIWASEVEWKPEVDKACDITLPVTPRLFQANARLKVLNDYAHEKGMTLYEDWEEWSSNWLSGATGVESSYTPSATHCGGLTQAQCAEKGDNADAHIGSKGCAWIEGDCVPATIKYPGKPPRGISKIYITDGDYFAYYYLQDALLTECVNGIMLALILAYIILNIATGNYIIATVSITVITIVVTMIMGFTVMLGWKLGILESIIYVMVVGMAVDYVVHLAESYLDSKYEDRHSRARDMLEIRGFSVLSGAISTLGGIFFLFFAFIVFFLKFATVIFFLIFTSLIYSLVFFTAVMDSIGPNGEFGAWKLVWQDIKRVYAGEIPVTDCIHNCCVPHDSEHFKGLTHYGETTDYTDEENADKVNTEDAK